MKIRRYLLILILGGNFICAKAQYNLVQTADQEAEVKNYTKAIQLYQKAIKDNVNSRNASVLRKIGDCFNAVNQFQAALGYYTKYLELEENFVEKEFRMNYSEMLLKSGLVDRALKGFSELALEFPEDTEVKRMILCCEFALSELNKTNLPPISNQELINSSESEFGLGFFNNELVFSSQRLTNDYSSIHGRTNQGYSDLYSAHFDTVYNMYTSPERLRGHINTQLFNEGTFSYNTKYNTAYFSQCEKDPELCRILKSTYEKNKWQTPEVVTVGDEKYNYAHPCLTADGKTMYFVSDMPGGFGGKDIWKASVLRGGKLGTPVHLGEEINTPKDEMFPAIIADSILLFASEGHIGMGGLDIFYSKISGDIYDQPKNLGAPINSSSDDFSILLNRDLKGGYFCSNRNDESNSDDIYAFYHNIFLTDISGQIVDSIAALPLADVKIVYSTNGINKKIVYSDSKGYFTVPNTAHASCSEKHELSLTKTGFLTKKLTVPCSAEKSYLITMSDNSGEHSLAGIVSDKSSLDKIEGVKITIKSLKGITDSTYTKADGSYFFEHIPSNDYLIVRASKIDYLKDSKTFISPENTGKVVMSTKTNFDTNFELYPILLEVEFTINDIYYEFDSANLLSESKSSLHKLVNLLDENPQLQIKINSHTDSRGTNSYNLDLSNRRGASVVSYLIQAGISPRRLISQGFGESQLAIVNAATEEEHQKNRRTTFEIIGTNAIVKGNGNNDTNQKYTIKLRDEALLKHVKNSGNVSESVHTENILEQNATTDVSSSTVNSLSAQAPLMKYNDVFRIQLMVSSKEIDVKLTFDPVFKLVGDYQIYTVKKGELRKYQLGNFDNRSTAELLKEKCQQTEFKDCFIVKVDEGVPQ